MTTVFHRILRGGVLTALLLTVGSACSSKKGGGGGPDPITLDPTDYTYLLSESPANLPLWTTPATHKLRTHERPPEATRSGLSLSAARNEFEPLQLVVGPASGTVTVAIDAFPNLGADQRVELFSVGYENGWAETLTPLLSGGSVSLNGGQGTPIWIRIYVPRGAPAGDHQTTLRITRSGTTTAIPVSLYVFDFAIPDDIGYATQLNVSVSDLMGGGSVDDAKNLLFEHRFTPKSVSWPSGFRWGITWENGTDACNTFWDEPDEPDEYAIGWLSRRYILGEGWNGIGFPNAMIFQFVDNSTPRPGSFCGLSRGDHYGTPEYNAEWAQWLGALEGYLASNGMIGKAYYYVQNEPQNDDDHQLAAHLCRITRAAAPQLRIAISEEPKPEIAEDAAGGCGYDIWIAHVRAYEQNYAWSRQSNFGEEVWFYSLDHDPDPYFNPTLVEKQGLHMRIIPWVSWHYRVTGWAYYDANRFFRGAQPTIRAELLREGIEDYEYLLLANGGGRPQVGVSEPADPTVDSAASSLTSWTKDPDALMALRHQLGLYIEGTRATLPTLEVQTSARPRGAYYLNFQDPGGAPTADPLVIGGKTYLKIGWIPYNDSDNYGWYGEFIEDAGIALYGYDDVGGYDETQKSYIYDDYGRDNLFEFALANGRYDVTIAVGRPQRGYPGDPHNATVEGITVVDDELTTDAEPTIVRTVTVDLTDGSLSIEVGGRSASTGNYSYTFLGFIDIEPVN